MLDGPVMLQTNLTVVERVHLQSSKFAMGVTTRLLRGIKTYYNNSIPDTGFSFEAGGQMYRLVVSHSTSSTLIPIFWSFTFTVHFSIVNSSPA